MRFFEILLLYGARVVVSVAVFVEVVCNFFFCVFRAPHHFFNDSGFGSVFDGQGIGQFANVSTQAVLDLIKHTSADQSNLVEIAVQDIESFNIGRSDGAELHGEIVFLVILVELN